VELSRYGCPEICAFCFPPISTAKIAIPGTTFTEKIQTRTMAPCAPNPSTPRASRPQRSTTSPFRNALILSPYSAIFCRQSSRTSQRNYKKEHTLLKSAQDSSPKPAANSLFHNILRVSPSGSGFCRASRRSGSRNLNELNILRNREEKTGRSLPYELSPTAAFSSRSRNFWTSSAIAYFSSSIPLPVTAEIS
jgi:hypothetical protein